jgi:hypothetical protein
MHDVDRPTQIQALADPPGDRRPSIQAKPLRALVRSESVDGISGHCDRRRHLEQGTAVRPPEL